eukprot:TRINITY_DN2710_c1_g1_i4.p1 TRINITY_DN2710_c1_g1~~TRINITY_DN2710_c1_g1_i4.p1  ORF type:complete len:174 (-),score=6.50 TRINITY_DN2710_c1_g1_i4:91-612(-)
MLLLVGLKCTAFMFFLLGHATPQIMQVQQLDWHGKSQEESQSIGSKSVLIWFERRFASTVSIPAHRDASFTISAYEPAQSDGIWMSPISRRSPLAYICRILLETGSPDVCLVLLSSFFNFSLGKNHRGISCCPRAFSFCCSRSLGPTPLYSWMAACPSELGLVFQLARIRNDC